jgi:hypothetical protein
MVDELLTEKYLERIDRGLIEVLSHNLLERR